MGSKVGVCGRSGCLWVGLSAKSDVRGRSGILEFSELFFDPFEVIFELLVDNFEGVDAALKLSAGLSKLLVVAKQALVLLFQLDFARIVRS